VAGKPDAHRDDLAEDLTDPEFRLHHLLEWAGISLGA
jgi:hypothetical protein